MTWSKFFRLVYQSLRRNKSDVALASVGIVAGISALFVFTALGSGITRVVLEDVFDIRQIEVVPPSVAAESDESEDSGGGGLAGSLLGGGSSGTPTISAETIQRLRELPEVDAAYPKMKLTFPASIRGGKEIIGQTMFAELVADGVPERLIDVSADSATLAFRDWQSIDCESSEACTAGYTCHRGTCRGQSCRPNDGGESSCPSPTYCDGQDRRCRMPIPAVASKTLMEMLESNIQTALQGSSSSLARLSGLSKDALVGLEADAIFGASYLGRAKQGDPRRRRIRLVGFSRQAIDLGATIPLGYVQRLNRDLGGGSKDGFHSVLLDVPRESDVTRVAQTITDDFGLALSSEYRSAQQAGLIITLMTLVFNAISLAILAIAAVHITHTLLMILLERRREIGLMRAVGATPSDIGWLVFGEATVLGLTAGLGGLTVGWLTITGIDWAFATWVPAFPFKPDTLFQIVWWMPLAGLGAAVLFTWLGALVPAARAARIDPADALTR
jgi:ABC-type lipoprotein release transport system permease subunit